MKKMHPVGICNKCHGITYRSEAVNQRCGRSPNGRRCRGVFKNASNDAHWKECTACKASGKYEMRLCPFCSGIGWNYVRVGGPSRAYGVKAPAAASVAEDKK